MSKAPTVNSISTPGSISRRSGRTSKPLEDANGARSSSVGGSDVKKGRKGGTSMTTPPAAAAPSSQPWKHPDELPFVRREDWTQELMIDYLVKKSFTVPPNNYRSKDPFCAITPRSGQPVQVPRRYRIPILFLAKFQWDSIRIALTAEDPVADWNGCKYEIIHISRACQHFLDAARAAAEIKGPGGMSRTWRCPMLDRLLVRFFSHWFLSDEYWLRRFHEEFTEKDFREDYEEILEKDWQRWALKGHLGFQLTKQEIADGITATQFMDGLTRTYGGWTWVPGPNVEEGSRSTSPSIASVFIPSETPQQGSEVSGPSTQIASASADVFPPTQPTSPSDPESAKRATPPAATESASSQVSVKETSASRAVSKASIGSKRARDAADVDTDQQTKKAKKSSKSPETPSLPSGGSVTAQVVTESKADPPSSRKSSPSVGDVAAPAGASAVVPLRATTIQHEPSSRRKRADSIASTDSSLSNLTSSSRFASKSPPPQSLAEILPVPSVPDNGEGSKAATPAPLPESAAPAAPWISDPPPVHAPSAIATPSPFLPEDLGPAAVDRDMSVSPIVRSTALSGSHSAVAAGAEPSARDVGDTPDVELQGPGVPPRADSLPAERLPIPLAAPIPTYQHPPTNLYHSYLSNATTPAPNMSSSTTAPEAVPTPSYPVTSVFQPPSFSFPHFWRPVGASGTEPYVGRTFFVPTSPPHQPNNESREIPLSTGADSNFINMTSPAPRNSFSTMTAFAQVGLPDPNEKTQKLHASLLVRDLLDFMQASSWKRNHSLAHGERGPVEDAKTRHLVLDCDHAMSVDQRFVILKNSVLAIINRFDGMKAEQLEKEIADVDSKLKQIFDETWEALGLPNREEQTSRDIDVQTSSGPADNVTHATAPVQDTGAQASVEPVRQLLEEVGIQPQNPSSNTAEPLSRPSVSPDATMIDLTSPLNDHKNPEADISVKAAMTSIMDLMQNFVESSKSKLEPSESTDSSILATVMAEFKAMKDDLKKAQQMNRQELQNSNELHRNEVQSLKEELRLREQQRKADMESLKISHRAEVEALRGTIRTMEKERERMIASEDDATRMPPQDLLELRRRISALESLPRSPGFPSDHAMASPPLSAASTVRSEPPAPKIQAHPLSHLIAIDGEDTPAPFSPRTHMASMRESSASKPGTPLSSERGGVSRKPSMDVAEETAVPMPVKTQRKPYMFTPRPSVG